MSIMQLGLSLDSDPEWHKYFNKWMTCLIGYMDESQRRGQRLYNALHELDADMARKIAGTEFDPFHNDAMRAACVQRVYTLWKEREDGN